VISSSRIAFAGRGSVAGDNPDSSLIVPLIKRAEPEGAGGSSPLSWPEGDTPIADQLAGELYVFYGFDLPGAFRLVSRRDCARMQLAAGDLRPLAVRNLTRRRARPQIKQAPAAAMFVLDGNLESSLLLVDHLWEQIDPQLPGELIAAVPSRDTLAVTGSQVPGGIAALTRCADAVWRQSTTHLLTRSLLIRYGPSWQVLPSAGQP
jgi:uncharacterized protein YtpQ (UPF0354 family)